MIEWKPTWYRSDSPAGLCQVFLTPYDTWNATVAVWRSGDLVPIDVGHYPTAELAQAACETRIAAETSGLARCGAVSVDADGLEVAP